jgi:hypothetical protein
VHENRASYMEEELVSKWQRVARRDNLAIKYVKWERSKQQYAKCSNKSMTRRCE